MAQVAPSPELPRIEAEIDACLELPQPEQEAAAETVFGRLAELTAKTCLLQYST